MHSIRSALLRLLLAVCKFNMANSAVAIAELAEAVSALNRPKVPAPAPFTGVGRIECLFSEFERYAESCYGENFNSYLRTLPEFLTGEALSLLKAFGSGSDVTYEVVKARIIQDLNDRKSIVQNSFADFVGMKRERDESLPCYRIRLEMYRYQNFNQYRYLNFDVNRYRYLKFEINRY